MHLMKDISVKCHIKKADRRSQTKRRKKNKPNLPNIHGLFRMRPDKEHMAAQCLSTDAGFLHRYLPHTHSLKTHA